MHKDQKKLPTTLKEIKYAVERFMINRCRLKPFFMGDDGSKSEVIFEMLDYQQMNEFASYGGFPKRFHHWSFGMTYVEQSKGYEYGLHKIYEMVINNNPVYAYLLEDNSPVDQKLVMAHVYAHADFFVNNVYFRYSNRKALDLFSNNALKIDQYIERYGQDIVETWIDICLSLDNLIDRSIGTSPASDIRNHRSLLRRNGEKVPSEFDPKLPAKEYMDPYINPHGLIEKERKEFEQQHEREKNIRERKLIFPEEPVRDIMAFLAEHAPLEEWQRDVLFMIRDEAYYFVPQAQTKIMNEGWAAFWHSRAMTGGLLTDSELIDYADHNAGTTVVHPGGLNPYLLGREIFRDIVRRWDSHRHGKIHDGCEDRTILENWELFVAFKNIFEECGDDLEALSKRWHEFVCFRKALQTGRFGFPKEIYDPDLLLRHWHYYHTADKELDELDAEIAQYEKEQNRSSSRLQQATAVGDKNARAHFSLEKELIKKDIKHCMRIRKILFGLKKISQAFHAGRLVADPHPIPDLFFEYARRFPGKLPIGQGMDKIFQVRLLYCDLTFIDEFLTEDLFGRLRLFAYVRNKDSRQYEVATKDFLDVKDALLTRLTNSGQPDIRVENANYNNRNELLLKHYFGGFELSDQRAKRQLRNLFKVWQRPVHLDTMYDNEPKKLSYVGKEKEQKK